jgi:ABC-type glutathione transport system ATPase component
MQTIHLPAPTPRFRSARTRTIRQWFDLQPEPRERVVASSLPVLPPGSLTLLAGPSGSGKSTLLRHLSQAVGPRALHLDAIDLPERPLVDLFTNCTLDEALRHLSRVGLAEAWTWVRTPSELSEGQRYRLRLALALHAIASQPSAGTILFCDEFCALLDRVTASVIACVVRRAVDRQKLTICLATSHDDLLAPLRPDQLITCDFGQYSVARPRSSFDRSPMDAEEVG